MTAIIEVVPPTDKTLCPHLWNAEDGSRVCMAPFAVWQSKIKKEQGCFACPGIRKFQLDWYRDYGSKPPNPIQGTTVTYRGLTLRVGYVSLECSLTIEEAIDALLKVREVSELGGVNYATTSNGDEWLFFVSDDGFYHGGHHYSVSDWFRSGLTVDCMGEPLQPWPEIGSTTQLPAEVRERLEFLRESYEAWSAPLEDGEEPEYSRANARAEEANRLKAEFGL